MSLFLCGANNAFADETLSIYFNIQASRLAGPDCAAEYLSGRPEKLEMNLVNVGSQTQNMHFYGEATPARSLGGQSFNIKVVLDETISPTGATDFLAGLEMNTNDPVTSPLTIYTHAQKIEDLDLSAGGLEITGTDQCTYLQTAAILGSLPY
jgi:hypothetical protein